MALLQQLKFSKQREKKSMRKWGPEKWGLKFTYPRRKGTARAAQGPGACDSTKRMQS